MIELDPIVEGLKKQMERDGLSVRGVAREIGKDATAISRVLRRERRAGRDLIEAIVGRYPHLGTVFVHGVTDGSIGGDK